MEIDSRSFRRARDGGFGDKRLPALILEGKQDISPAPSSRLAVSKILELFSNDNSGNGKLFTFCGSYNITEPLLHILFVRLESSKGTRWNLEGCIVRRYATYL